MSTGETPTIGLLLGDDNLENENWTKLDRALRVLVRDIIPESVLIQGALEVTGNTKLDGTLEVVGAAQFDSSLTVATNLTTANLLVTGAVNLPPGSVAGSAITPGTGLYTAQTGFAQTAQQSLSTTYTDLGEIVMSPPDDVNRFELVIASLQCQMGLASDQTGGVSQQVTFNLKRGTSPAIVQQSRILNYTYTRAAYIDYAWTMVRLTKPPASDTPRWSIEGKIGTSNLLTATMTFVQLAVVQFR